MAYQIPSKVKALFLLGETKIPLYKITPQVIGSSPLNARSLVLKHSVVTMFIKGHLASDFKMRINLYADDVGSKVLVSSTPINNLDISRTNDLYTELRFDMPQLGNVMSAGKPHLVEFEIYDGYVYDNNNYVAIIYDYFAAQNFLGSDAIVELADYNEFSAKCSFFFDTPNEGTEKFFMCRLQGAKLLNGIVNHLEIQFFPSRQYYTATIQKGLSIKSPIIVTYVNFGSKTTTNVFDNIDDFTPDPLNPDTNINRFHYDKLTGELKVYIDQSLNETCYAIAEYYLFVTDTRGKYYGKNMDENDIVYWDARLAGKPQFDFSQENNLQGILSISSSSVELKNEDGYLNDFFSVNDCFSNREIKMWQCEGDVSNKKVAFVGLIRGAEISDDKCVFSITDPLARLDDVYSDFRPTTVKDLVDASTGAYTARVADIERIVPRVLGKISSFKMLTKYTGQSIDIPWFDKDGMIECTNVSYAPVFATNNNRVWSVGFGPAVAATMSRDVTAVADFVSGTFVASKFTIDNALGPVSEWLPPGTCIVNNGKYGIVYASTATEAYVWPKNAGFTAASDIIRHKVISVIVERDGGWVYPLAGESYTCQIGVAGDLQITFANSFETLPDVGLGTALDPNNDRVYAVFMNDDSDSVASHIVKNLLLDLDMTVNGQFEPPIPPDWTDPNLAITLPFPGETDLPKVRDIVSLALKSAMSCIYFDDSGFLRYKSFLQPIESDLAYVDNQSGFDPSDEINQSNSSEFSVKLDLWDLYGGTSFKFTHCQMYASWKIEYEMVKDFYKTRNLYEADCALDPTRQNTEAFLGDYAKLVMGRSAIYSLKALSDQANLWIGDDILVSRKTLIGGENAQTLRVVSTSKEVSNARLSLLDLKRFPAI